MQFMAVVFFIARVATEIRSGGAWTRTVALTGQQKSGVPSKAGPRDASHSRMGRQYGLLAQDF
jgi:hypothetical protein